jgi:phosphomannomutase
MYRQRFGEHHYSRVDLHLPELQKQDAVRRASAGVTEIGGMKVLRTDKLDGTKFFLDNPEASTKPNAAETWLLLRASGTEPLLRVYCESCSPESVKKILDAGCAFAKGESS